MQNPVYIPRMLEKLGDSAFANIVAIFLGVCLLSAMAQISIHLPYTPVPATGQTFGVTLTALLWGRKRGMAVMGVYLALGALGLPIFASGMSGLLLGPTLGYLIGMFFAALLMGTLSDRAWSQKFHTAMGAAVLGSIVVFGFGLVGLSFFIPKAQLLSAGLIPFLPGDFLKDLIASQIAYRFNSK